MNNKAVKTRFAPSPTGYLHIGGVRTALYCWLYAQRHGGTFVLRIEDTDRERSTEEAIGVIIDGMSWLGLDADEGPYFQTQRLERYRELTGKLLADGNAYHCYCSKEELEKMRNEQMARKEKPRYDGRCRNRTAPIEGVDPVVRFRNPDEGQVVVDDLVRGRVVFDNSELDDLVIVRSDGIPTYNFSVVVDDWDMAISHVIRGDDHLNNTPRQINIFSALDAEPPRYAHLPLIMGQDGVRLSKRHGAVSVLHYRDEGYLPEALLNYLVRLGWSHGDQELFSVEELCRLFDVGDVNKSASTFSPDKLLWINQQHIMKSTTERLAPELSKQYELIGVSTDDGPEPAAVVEALKERAQTMRDMAQSSAFFYVDFDEYDEKAARKNLKAETREAVAQVKQALAELAYWQAEPIHEAIVATAEKLELKLGKVAQPIRVAVSGGPVSPPIDVTLELLGRDKTLQRIDRALAHIDSKAS